MVSYSELQELLQDKQNSAHARYTELYRILQQILTEATSQTRLDFSGPFARLMWVADKWNLTRDLRYRLNGLRARCRVLSNATEEELDASLPYDICSVAELIQLLQKEEIPTELAKLLPKGKSRWKSEKRSTGYLRVSVQEILDDTLLKAIDENQEEHLVNYAEKGDYLKSLMQKGSQLNLIRPIRKEGILYPELIILEPDYLVDISTIAQCYQSYGTTPYALLISRMEESQNCRGSILLGNWAGQMLDEEVNNPTDHPINIRESANRFMYRNALAMAACQENLGMIGHEAMQQQENLHTILCTAQHNVLHFDLQHILLEPSFFCEMLGLQGRMDLLQDDYHVLMEQKSGKKDFRTNGHVEKHYVQMLLYQALLHYNHGLRNDEISSFLLYSRYPDGLIQEGPAPTLLLQAIRIRNQLTWLEFRMSQGGSTMVNHLTPDKLRLTEMKDEYWQRYVQPGLSRSLTTVQQANPVAQAYYHRMMTFVAREHLLAKIGTPGREGSGMASLWNSSLEEKRTAGNIFLGMKILSLEGTDGVETITLDVPKQEEGYLPNFRTGDAAILYTYPEGTEPDVRRGIVFRTQIEEIRQDSIRVHLRATQRNKFVFQTRPGMLWALEHDTTESAFGTLYRSVYSLLTATPDRRELILARRKPTWDENQTLSGDYGDFNPLVLSAKQAKDYFLLIGPPGTGKTSFGLMNIVRETLTQEGNSLLLLSYTNRAVDEICSKLVEAGLDFLRIGQPQSCPECYHPYLLENRVKDYGSLMEIRTMILDARIIIGTTTTLSSRPELFTLRTFSLAVIDEASQILEPHLMGILCARHGNKNAVERFVMIGDHKQLPAVVQQTNEDSLVEEASLHEIGLIDCRESLFQRLLRLQQKDYPDGNSPYVYRFRKQGRMHPEVADFASRAFYGGNLEPVPLPHQQSVLTFSEIDENDEMQHLLGHQRIIFLPSERPLHTESPKVNPIEAHMIARVVKAVHELYVLNARTFSPSETIGIIVPYRHQIALVRSELANLGIPGLTDLTIDTVERYQGSQRDVIIYGFTIQRAYQLDFLCSQSFEEDGKRIDRKLNVALTRAKEQMVLIGNPDLLSQDPVHKELLDYLTSRQNCSR